MCQPFAVKKRASLISTTWLEQLCSASKARPALKTGLVCPQPFHQICCISANHWGLHCHANKTSSHSTNWQVPQRVISQPIKLDVFLLSLLRHPEGLILNQMNHSDWRKSVNLSLSCRKLWKTFTYLQHFFYITRSKAMLRDRGQHNKHRKAVTTQTQRKVRRIKDKCTKIVGDLSEILMFLSHINLFKG